MQQGIQMTHLDVRFSLWHGPKVLQDLVPEAVLEVLEPGAGLFIHRVMQLLQLGQLLSIVHLIGQSNPSINRQAR